MEELPEEPLKLEEGKWYKAKFTKDSEEELIICMDNNVLYREVLYRAGDEDIYSPSQFYKIWPDPVELSKIESLNTELEAARKEIEELKLIAKQDIIDFKKFKDQYIINDFINGIITSPMTHDQWYSLFKQQQNG
jgi:hypothetical protein